MEPNFMEEYCGIYLGYFYKVLLLGGKRYILVRIPPSCKFYSKLNIRVDGVKLFAQVAKVDDDKIVLFSVHDKQHCLLDIGALVDERPMTLITLINTIIKEDSGFKDAECETFQSVNRLALKLIETLYMGDYKTEEIIGGEIYEGSS